MEHAYQVILTIVILAILAGLYMLPTLVAFDRKHNERAAIMVLNLLLGWTFFGWAIAFVWGCTGDVEKKSRPMATKKGFPWDPDKPWPTPSPLSQNQKKAIGEGKVHLRKSNELINPNRP